MAKINALRWIAENVKDAETRRFVSQVGRLPTEEAARMLEDRARAKGVSNCDLASLWRRAAHY